MNLTSYFLTFTEGVLTFISPCLLPMLPIYFLYLAGSIDGKESQTSLNKSRLVINSIGFITGFTIVYIALGITVSSLSHFLSSYRDLFRIISGLVMIAFGLYFVGLLKLRFLNGEKKLDFKFRKPGFIGSILFGIVFGFSWTPCIGYYLGSALALAVGSDSILNGLLLLLVYSIGLGIPFLLTSIVFEKARGAIRQIQKYTHIINFVSGILLIAAGFMVLTDTFKYISYII